MATTNAKTLIFKKKIGDAIYELAVKTDVDRVLVDDTTTLRQAITTITETVAQKASQTQLNELVTKFNSLTNGADEAYDTLQEIGSYLNEHTTAYEALQLLVGNKVTQIKEGYVLCEESTEGAIQVVASGAIDGQINLADVNPVAEIAGTIKAGDYVIYQKAKGLSTNDFTDADKQKLENMTQYVHPTSGVTAGSYTKVTVDSKGHVMDGENPSTLAGFGIGDAYTKTQVDELFGANTKIVITEGEGETPALKDGDIWIQVVDQEQEPVA